MSSEEQEHLVSHQNAWNSSISAVLNEVEAWKEANCSVSLNDWYDAPDEMGGIAHWFASAGVLITHGGRERASEAAWFSFTCCPTGHQKLPVSVMFITNKAGHWL